MQADEPARPTRVTSLHELVESLAEDGFVLVEDVVNLFLDRLFPGFEPLATGVFRVLRDSEMDIDEEAEDLVKTFESALKRRRRGIVIRLGVSADMPETLRDFVAEKIGAREADLFSMERLIGLADIKRLIVEEAAAGLD